MASILKQLFWNGCYYLFLLFFVVGLYSLNLVCLVATFLMPPKAAQWLLLMLVQKLFHLFISIMTHSGILRCNCDILKRLHPDKSGRLIIANHPSIFDAPFLISRIPGLLCVFKSSLKQSFMISRTTRTLGYLSNEEGIVLLKKMAAQLKAGKQVLLFPEGTRTSGNSMNSMNPSYALAAMRARVPVQLVRIRTDSPILGKGWPLLKTARFPVSFHFDLGPSIEPDSFTTIKTFNAFVENWYRKNVNQPNSLKYPSLPALHTIATSTDQSLMVSFRVPDDPLYCQGHMPGNPLVPAYTQMAWVREILREHDSSPTGYCRWKFTQPILPGNAIEISISPQAPKRNVIIYSEGKRAAQGKLLYNNVAKEALV
jgi:1-acyl-sn-glycerol-3-phosphate acyltransferase